MLTGPSTTRSLCSSPHTCGCLRIIRNGVGQAVNAFPLKMERMRASKITRSDEETTEGEEGCGLFTPKWLVQKTGFERPATDDKEAV